jgi:hypothetical protein
MPARPANHLSPQQLTTFAGKLPYAAARSVGRHRGGCAAPGYFAKILVDRPACADNGTKF